MIIAHGWEYNKNGSAYRPQQPKKTEGQCIHMNQYLYRANAGKEVRGMVSLLCFLTLMGRCMFFGGM